jgi:hypothetical protein
VREKTGSSKRREREQFWRRVVGGQPRSGMSVAAWCKQQGVSAPSFYVWRQRLANRGAARKLRRRDDEIVAVRIAWEESELRERAKRLGALWRPAHKVWEMTWGNAKRLGLSQRVAQSET